MRNSSLMRMQLGFAGAMALAAGLGRGIEGATSRALNFNPTAKRAKPAVNFSSARQHQRNARTQEMRVVNGFEVMQTLPSGLRRSVLEVEQRLAAVQ